MQKGFLDLNNIPIGLIGSNFQARGYSVTRIEINGVCDMLIPYKIYNGTLNAVAIVNFENGDEWTKDDYHNVLRSFKNKVYTNEVVQVNILQVICTRKPECIEQLGVEFSPYWIADIEKELLLVYENQPVRFCDARNIIEDSLEGTQYELSKSHSFFAQEKKSFPIFTAILVLINVAVFTYMEFIGSTENVDFMQNHGALSYTEVIFGGQYYRVLTSFFLHFGMEHLFNNMVVLIVLGYHLENAINRIWYIVIYMSSGVVSGIASMWWWHYFEGNDYVSAGASGAIFGIIGAMAALFIVNRGKFEDIGFGRMFMFLLLTLFSGFQNAEIDNAAHVSGFIFGMFIMFVIIAGKYVGTKHRKGNDI